MAETLFGGLEGVDKEEIFREEAIQIILEEFEDPDEQLYQLIITETALDVFYEN